MHKWSFRGVKSEKGFHDYSSRKMSDVLKERDMKLIKLMKFLKIPSLHLSNGN
jgi:hypothetical protein